MYVSAPRFYSFCFDKIVTSRFIINMCVLRNTLLIQHVIDMKLINHIVVKQSLKRTLDILNVPK